MPKLIAPSILSCDFANVAAECESVLQGGADWLHIDVMDGHFVPNITIGPCVVEAIRKAVPGAYLDCHLMIEKPQNWIDQFHKVGANVITFHFEAFDGDRNQQCIELIKLIKTKNIKAGVSIKPKTQASELSDQLLSEVDLILIMTVEPGFGGQSYMPECAEKCKQLKQRNPDLLVEVDGGINDTTIIHAAEQGIDVFVAGSYIFNAADRKEKLQTLKK